MLPEHVRDAAKGIAAMHPSKVAFLLRTASLSTNMRAARQRQTSPLLSWREVVGAFLSDRFGSTKHNRRPGPATRSRAHIAFRVLSRGQGLR